MDYMRQKIPHSLKDALTLLWVVSLGTPPNSHSEEPKKNSLPVLAAEEKVTIVKCDKRILQKKKRPTVFIMSFFFFVCILIF